MSEGMPISKVSAEDRKLYAELQAKIHAEAEAAKGMKKAMTSKMPVVENFDEIIDLCTALNNKSLMETFDPPAGSNYGNYSIKLMLSVIELDDKALEKRKAKAAANADAIEVE